MVEILCDLSKICSKPNWQMASLMFWQDSWVTWTGGKPKADWSGLDVASAAGGKKAPVLDMIDGEVATVAPCIPLGGTASIKDEPMARNPRPHAKRKHDEIEKAKAKTKEKLLKSSDWSTGVCWTECGIQSKMNSMTSTFIMTQTITSVINWHGYDDVYYREWCKRVMQVTMAKSRLCTWSTQVS